VQFAPFGPATRLSAERGISSASLQFAFRKPNITSERFGNLHLFRRAKGRVREYAFLCMKNFAGGRQRPARA
jgi:hypothetical protein